MFVNGVLDTYDAGHEPFRGAGKVVSIGVSNGDWDSFSGQISEVRIWSVALPCRAIRARWATRLTGSEAGLSSYWPLSEGAGKPKNAVVEESSGAPDPEVGAFTGSPTRVKGDVPVVASRSAPAWRFDGTGWVVIDDSEHMLGDGTGPFSVEAWVRPDQSEKRSGWQSPVVSQHGIAMGWELRANTSELDMMVTASRGHVHAESSVRLEPEIWQHIRGVYDGREIRLY